MVMTSGKSVAVIGSGASGLSSIKTCLEYGLEPTAFEQHDNIGGLWYYTDTSRYNQGSASYKNLILNTPSNSTAFSDFPCPKGEPLYQPHKHYWTYLNSYAEHFGLRKYIKFQTEVTQVYRDESTGKWIVHFKKVVNQSEETLKEDKEPSVAVFDYVIVSCGIHRKPILPPFKGKEKFEGEVLHSNQFRDASVYQEKNVIVIGAGNSAGDVACEIAHLSNKRVHLSTRNGVWLVGRYLHPGKISTIAKLSVRFSAYLQALLPMFLYDWYANKLVNTLTNHSGFGLNPKLSFSKKSAMMTSDHMVSLLGSGRIKLVTGIDHLTEKDVHLTNGDVIKDVDVIFCGTGYDCNYGMVDSSVFGGPTFTETRLYKNIWPLTQEHTLAVVGIVAGEGAIPPVFEMQARWVLSVFTEQSLLPSLRKMKKVFEDDRKASISYYGCIRAQRPYIPYNDFLASQVGCYPGLLAVLWKYKSLALIRKLWFGSHVPFQYRLVGPHQWLGAYEMCMKHQNSIAFLHPS